MIDERAAKKAVWLQLSNYKKFKLDSCNWIPTWPLYKYVANRRAENQSRASIWYRYDYTDNTRGYFTSCVKMRAMSKMSASIICNTIE